MKDNTGVRAEKPTELLEAAELIKFLAENQGITEREAALGALRMAVYFIQKEQEGYTVVLQKEE